MKVNDTKKPRTENRPESQIAPDTGGEFSGHAASLKRVNSYD